MQSTLPLNVVVPIYNSFQVLSKSLWALDVQTVAIDAWEVVIVDDQRFVEEHLHSLGYL